LSEMEGIIRLRGIDAKVEPQRWDFAEERKAEIDALWEKQIAKRPRMFNGIVLLQHRWRIEDGIYHARYAPVNYASFTAWITLGKPGAPRRNGFAMGALRASDGAFLLGEMGIHTFNAGKIYFPAGTPDMDDVLPDQTLDLAGSLVREITEETGLRPNEFSVSEDWAVISDDYRAAFLRPVQVHMSADEARSLILSRLVTETDGELSDIRIIRSLADLNEPKLPEFARTYMADAFARG
jgi:8-oxo-dGTP pyrophosphatase MutT (NUDIX family)